MNKSNKLIIFVIGISTENQILILKIKQSIHYPLQQYNKIEYLQNQKKKIRNFQGL